MAILVFTTRNFDRVVAKLPSKVIAAYKERFEIFLFDQFNPILKNHKLGGQLRNYRSINITGDYRLIYEEYDDVTIRLIDIGRHGQIYGK